MDNEYFIQTSYISSPPTFIKTLGGFYSKEGTSINVALEFKSNFRALSTYSSGWLAPLRKLKLDVIQSSE